MEELKRLLALLHSFHKSSCHSPPLSLTTLFCVCVCTVNTALEEGNTVLLITHPAPAMDKKSCPEGEKWDHLVHTCVPSKSLMGPNTNPPRGLPLSAVNQLEAINTTAKPNSLVVLSPALWIFVVLVVVGSILALTVWFIIWKRQTRRSSTCENGILGVKLLQNAAPPAKLHPLPPEKNGQAEIFQNVAEAPSICFYVNPGSQTGSKWEDDFTASRDLPMRAGAEVGGGSPACSTMAEHRIPLPATELGGTALVTTKTM